jgi:soluble P-type ATPase
MNKKELLKEIKASKSKYVTYGDGDLGMPILREDAIADIFSMEQDVIGKGTWYECDEHGNVPD